MLLFSAKNEVNRNLKLWLAPSFIKIYHHLEGRILLAKVYTYLCNPFSTEISTSDLKRDNQKNLSFSKLEFLQSKALFYSE